MPKVELYDMILDSSMDAVFIIHPDGSFCKSNSLATALFQFTNDELEQKGWLRITNNDQQHFLEDLLASGNKNKKGIFTSNKKDGLSIIVKFLAHHITTANGQSFISITFREVSKELEWENQVSLLINNTKEPFLLLNKKLEIVLFNNSFSNICAHYFKINIKKKERVLTYTRAELRAKRKKMYQRVLSGAVKVLELDLSVEGNAVKKFIVRSSPAKDDHGNIVGVFITANDITNEYIAEQKTLLSEEKYRSLFYNIPLPMWVYDQETKRFMEVNEQAVYVYGYSREEFSKMDIYDIRPKEDIPKLDGLVKFKKGKTLSYNGQWRHLLKSGEIIDVDITSHKIDFHKKEALLVIAQNITDKLRIEKQNEFEKREKEALINSTTDLMWSVDKDFKLIAANREFILTVKNWTGISLNAGDYLLNENKFPEDFLLFWKKNYEEALMGNSFKKEVYYPTAGDGTSLSWTETSFNPIYDEEDIIGIACYSRNITDRKNAEIKLQEAMTQQSLFVSIVNSSDYAIISKTLRSVITSWNKGAEKLFGYTADEVIGKNVGIIIPDYLIDEQPNIIKKIKNGEYVEYYETERVRKDGSIIDVSLTISPVKDSKGVIVGASKIARDITEKKKTDTIIQAALKERNTILESIGDAFFTVDKTWTVTYWNKEAEKMLHIPKTIIIGHGLWEIFKDSINSVSYENYHKAIETNKVVAFEDYFPPLEKWFEISAYPSENGLAVYFKDITQRKFSEIQLKALNTSLHQQAKELAVSNTELEQFAYVASHDLQEPLRMVTSFLTQIEKKYGNIIDDKGKKYIAFAVDGAKRMRQIILDLLEFSRVGRNEDSPEKLNLNDLVEEIKILLRKYIEEKGAVITVEKLPVINAYKTPIRQVFQNLISNSLKYSKPKVNCTIHISVEEKIDEWLFCVADNGIGIDPEFHQRIFIIFQRLHNKDEFSGTGMGLAVTKKIIENQGGKIWIESEEGKGSNFYFSILKK